MAALDGFHGVGKRSRMRLNLFLRHDVDGIVNIELVMGNACQMVPKAVLIVVLAGCGRKQSRHNLDNRLGTALTLFAVFYLHGHIDHHLHAATVFGHYKLFSLCVVSHYVKV